MRNLFKRFLIVVMAVTLSMQLWAANTKQTVEQVTTTVDLENDVDYIVTSTTPFTTDGIVNIVNTEHAVIILQNVKPSKAISMLATHVKINGAKAVNNTNCQVKIYNRGSIILPYGNSFKPLTVYSEKNFEGESTDVFGLGNDGGFMNTLTDAQLNNRIRSFKLKRGYMVTFSIKAKGRGYSRCFIAADKDIEMASLPAILDRSISSYRIFKWQDTGKQALANDTRASSVSALNVTSCYSFGLGESRLPDAECVPHHIYENWPSSAECGSREYSAHMKTNNEPRNTADDHPQDLETILANWENLMATGMRLCSPSSWDGSDYTNGTGFLKSFFDEIDARGWRCDIVDLHCYWPEGNFGTISNWTSSTGRPVWISEWVWGASWNNNGAFASGVTETQNKEAVQRICNVLNNNANVERYYYWNSERNPSKLIRDDGSLTPAGQYYATINSGLGYKGKEFVPKVPPQVPPTDLSIDFDATTSKATLTWTESNGEMNEYIYVQKRENSSQTWVTVVDVPLTEETGIYTVSDVDAQVGWEFRIAEKMGNGTIKSTNTVMVVNNSVQAGDPVTIGEKTMYLGGNIIVNGSFDMGSYGWTNGQGSALDQPWFQVPAIGGADGSAYLQCYGNGGTNTVQAVKTAVKIEPNSDYYFMADACNMGDKSIARVGLSNNGTSINGGTAASFNNTSAVWLTSFYTFNSGNNEYVIILLNTLNAQACFDNFRLFRLFETKDEALADAAAKERLRAQAFMEYNPIFNNELTTQLATVKSDKQEDITYVKNLTDTAIKAAITLPLLRARANEVNSIVSEYPIIGSEELAAIAQEVADKNDITPQWVMDEYTALTDAMDEYMSLSTAEGKVQSPNFSSTNGWTVKSGTYQGGDQRLATQDGVTCWNAWWSLNPTGNTDKTMAIKQDIAAIDVPGLYFLECRASTQHYCLSDQHAFLTKDGETHVSPVLSKDYLDLTNISVDDRWETLTTPPFYVDNGESVTIGFESSKNGAVDNAYHKIGDTSASGDHREGWWCATDFALRFIPYYQTQVTAGQWQTGCLPYNVAASPKLKFYQIAGILSDYSALCLEEIEEVEAGEPFIYMSDEDMARFREYGEMKEKANGRGTGNLRGFYATTGNVPSKHYALIDGVWCKPEGRMPIGNYHAVLRPFDDKSSNPYTIFSSWNGPTIPITGITDSELEVLTADITSPSTFNHQPSTLYTTSGVPVKQQTLRPGVYIKVENGKPTKIIIR